MECTFSMLHNLHKYRCCVYPPLRPPSPSASPTKLRTIRSSTSFILLSNRHAISRPCRGLFASLNWVLFKFIINVFHLVFINNLMSSREVGHGDPGTRCHAIGAFCFCFSLRETIAWRICIAICNYSLATYTRLPEYILFQLIINKLIKIPVNLTALSLVKI